MATRINVKIDSGTIKAAGDFISLMFNLGKQARQNRSNHGNPYEVLGIAPDASIEQVKQRYLQLAKLFHPDTGNGDTKAMSKLNQAYQQISQGRGAQLKK